MLIQVLFLHDYNISFTSNFIPITGPSSSRARTGLDSPYVVQFHNCRVLAKAEELFTVRFFFMPHCYASRWKYVCKRTFLCITFNRELLFFCISCNLHFLCYIISRQHFTYPTNLMLHSLCHKIFTEQFSHPSSEPSNLVDNSRFRSASFIASETTTIHGFAGTFDCTLYDDIMFSTVPHTFSEGTYFHV